MIYSFINKKGKAMKEEMTTGELIKLARKKAGLTQAELGKRLNVSPAAISQFEKASANLTSETVKKIADVLGVDPFSLYSFDMASEALEKNIDKKESGLLDSYRQLNDTGQDKAIEQVELLAKIPEYRKEG